ncbi:olfactory receptor class A related 2 [Osmerus mordax]|uniref:olfactory receptor class A related 2 n=1 Tax=Osmerus mordax TaxID=8014 RepID=UPI00350EB878
MSGLMVRGLLYLSLTAIGLPGNVAVIAAFLLAYHQERRLLPADAIVLHLACANLLVVGVRCLLEVLASFSLANVFSDTGCKAVIYVYRTSRSLSIWLTFILSAYQCLSIAPPGSRWASARDLFARHLALAFVTVWVINTVMSSPAVMFSLGSNNNSTAMQYSINVEFCFVRFLSIDDRNANGAAQVTRDAVPMILMTLASLIILVFLYRHSQQVKGLRGGGAEQRAAKAVVTLVTVYVLFYGVDNGLWVYTLTVRQTMTSSVISDLRIFFSSLYAALSPMVIIASNRKVKNQLSCRAQEKATLDKATTLSTM